MRKEQSLSSVGPRAVVEVNDDPETAARRRAKYDAWVQNLGELRAAENQAKEGRSAAEFRLREAAERFALGGKPQKEALVEAREGVVEFLAWEALYERVKAKREKESRRTISPDLPWPRGHIEGHRDQKVTW